MANVFRVFNAEDGYEELAGGNWANQNSKNNDL